MVKINAIFLSLALCCNTVFADNCQVEPIKKGTPAPCDGFYFNKDAENQAEQYRSDADFYKKYSIQSDSKTAILEDENDVLQKRLQLYVKESQNLTKEKASKDTTEDLIRIGYFSLGVIITALIARNVRN